ncbi:MAG: hypothetical protein HRU00_17425 [Myxococcales bacterium]|nr:hypothetical protein [Myxococcales bacterium]
MSVHAWQAAGMDSPEHWERHGLEMRIRLAAQPYMDGSWGYDLHEPAVLWTLPEDMRASKVVGRSKKTNCSTLTTSLITSAHPTKPWTLLEYGDLQVFGERLPATDTPIQAVVRMGLGEAVEGFVNRRMHLVQGVRRLPGDPKGFSAHAYLVRKRKDGTLMVIEATSLKGANGQPIGPRYRRASIDDLRKQYPAALHIAVLED